MEPNPSASRFSVLGRADLQRPDGTTVQSVLAQPKRVALLAYLRLAGDGDVVTRDSVVSVFWPDVTEERARNALRQGIHFLRRSLSADLIERDADHLLRVPPEYLWCDAEAFETLLSEGRREEALALYRGPFLDGLPLEGGPPLDHWADATRRRLHALATDAAASLGRQALGSGKSVAAVDWGRRVLELDPLDERGVSLLVEAHAAEGDRVSAVRAYEEFAARLERELDLRPSEELESRLVDLRVGATASPTSGPVGPEGLGGSEAEPGARPVAVESRGGRAKLEAVPTSAPVSPEATTADRRRRNLTRTLVAVVAGLGLAALGRPLFSGGSNGTEVPTSGIKPSVAVLPFVNHSADTANAYFAAGVHESVLFNLSKIESLDVTALGAVQRYADSDAPLEVVADRLGVASIMTGSVQRDGDQIRIIVALVDPESGDQLWSETFDRRLDDVFAVQSEIARSVATSLRAVLTPSEIDRISQRPTDSFEALDYYMRGREAYRNLSLAGMNEALRYYGLAIEADPSFAPAWAGQADAHLQRVQFFGYAPAWADTARALADHAISLDPDLPEAHKTLGFVHSVHGRETDALAAAQRALELRPAYADALNNAGWSRYFLGDLVGAERLIRRSFRLEPTLPQLRSNVGAIWAALGRTDEAAEWLDRVLAANPGISATRTWRTYVDLERGEPGVALARAERYLLDEDPASGALARAAFAALLSRAAPTAAEYAGRARAEAPGVDLFDMRRVESILGMALLLLGRREEAEAAVRDAITATSARMANGADGWDPPWELAAAYAILGQRETAIRHLELAVDEGFPHATLLRLDPTFDAIREDTRFLGLLGMVERRAERQREEGRGAAAPEVDRPTER